MFCVMTAHANMEQLVNRTEVNPESRSDTLWVGWKFFVHIIQV